MANGLNSIIAQLERQKTAIERALAALSEVEGAAPMVTPRASLTATTGQSNKRSLAQKARWAAKKSSEVIPVAASEEAARKGGMTAEGRKRLAEAMKRRWAVKRTQATAAKKRGPKKAA